MKGPGIKVKTPATLTGPENLFESLGMALEAYFLEVLVKPGTSGSLQIQTFASRGIFDKCKIHPMQAGAEAMLSYLEVEPREVNLDLELYIRMPRIAGLGIHEAAAVAGAVAVLEALDQYLEKEQMLQLLYECNRKQGFGWRQVCLATSLMGGFRLYYDEDHQYRLPVPSGLYLAVLTPHKKQGEYFWPNFDKHLDRKVEHADSVRWGMLTLGLFQSNFEAIDHGLRMQPPFLKEHHLEQLYHEMVRVGLDSNMLGYPHINQQGNIVYGLFRNTLDAELGGEGLKQVLKRHDIIANLDLLSINQMGSDKM
jgi:hypothetical protein